MVYKRLPRARPVEPMPDRWNRSATRDFPAPDRWNRSATRDFPTPDQWNRCPTDGTDRLPETSARPIGGTDARPVELISPSFLWRERNVVYSFVRPPSLSALAPMHEWRRHTPLPLALDFPNRCFSRTPLLSILPSLLSQEQGRRRSSPSSSPKIQPWRPLETMELLSSSS